MSFNEIVDEFFGALKEGPRHEAMERVLRVWERRKARGEEEEAVMALAWLASALYAWARFARPERLMEEPEESARKDEKSGSGAGR